MKTVFEKVLSLTLVIAMTFGLFIFNPMTASATGTLDTWDGSIADAFADGSGSEGDPFQIATGTQLAYLAELINEGYPSYNNKHYKLMNDIDLNKLEWTPIGDSAHAFRGTFDGNGKTISNLTIRSSTGNTGLFGWVELIGTVKSLGVVDADINGGNQTGGIAGNASGHITNCYVTGKVSGTTRVGGIAGIAYGSITNCYATGKVSGTESVGGIAGNLSSGSVINCYATGEVSGTSDNVGGVAGSVSGSVINCYATGKVSGADYVGGVAGYVSGNVKNCAALNHSVRLTGAGTAVGRVIGSTVGSASLANNYAFDDLMDKDGVTTAWTHKFYDGVDGADVSIPDPTTASFWTMAGNWDASVLTDSFWYPSLGVTTWDTATIWTIEDGKLPVLKGLGGAQGETFPATLKGTATISNTSPKIGDVLTASLVGGNNVGTLIYLWIVGGTTATMSDTYTVVAADFGKTITVEITSNFETGTLTSAATSAVARQTTSGGGGGSGSAQTATISIVCKDVDGNILKTDSQTTTVGSSKTIAAPTIDGYKLVGDANKTITVKSGTNTVEFIYTEIPENPLTDITDHWAEDDILFVTENDLFSGTSADKFSPNVPMSRGMFVTVLGRYAGIDAAEYTTSRFSDVSVGTYYAGHIEWAAELGYVKGIGGGKFDPDAPVTREQVAVIFMNIIDKMNLKLDGTGTTVIFADNEKISYWAASAVNGIKDYGIISGKPNNMFDPKGTATRAEVATMFARLIKAVTV